MLLHPMSPWFWKSDLVLKSYSQFSIFGPNAPNKERECHAYFLWIYCFILKFLEPSHDSAYKELLILKIGSGTWKLQSIVHFWPKCPNQGNRVPHPIFIKLLFYFKIFTILSWFCIQRGLSFENRIRYMKVNDHFLFFAQVPQVRK